MSKYRIIATVLAIACLISFAVGYQRDKPALQNSNQKKIATVSSSSSSSQLHSSQTSTASTNAAFEEEFSPEVRTRLKALTPATEAWQRARGYRNTPDTDSCCNEGIESMDGAPREYEQYSIDQLQQLRAQGDMFAVHQLAKRMKRDADDRHQSFAQTKALYREAASLGSLYALTELEGIDLQLAMMNSKTNPELSHQLMLDYQAWSRVRALRNDLLSIYTQEVLLGINTTPDDKAAIQERAQHLYNELAQQRREKNLSEFDNSPSEYEQIVIAEIDRIRAQKAQRPSSSDTGKLNSSNP